MSIARTIAEQMERASWIRRMFEIGARMKAERGAENVFDFSLGNPEVEPPARVLEVLRRMASDAPPHGHGYMPNAGFPPVRERMAETLKAATGLPYTAGHIIMTVGSAGACNTYLKAVLDPGDEVIVLFPYFPEYRFYIENHGGRMVRVETGDDFQPDVARIAAAITPRTKAIILNSPNNPTGAVYGERVLRDLGALIDSLDHPVTVISDEPYKAIAFDGVKVPETAALIRRTVIAHSWSKSMAISGERIGYLAISPGLEEADKLRDACTFTNRILGYINAPAIWQWVIAETADQTVDVGLYQRKRDVICEALTRIGYHAPKPQGTFYVFPKAPIPDDMAFIERLVEEGILAVPGKGFGRSGYFRISLTVPMDVVERSIPGFERAFAAVNGLK
ncbi:MAG TPA: pyridoxal phosphate-dependent aminotransferase [Bryobacteraceae bacterium]|nr:pyridoxal phosphate-dependent aminotransferase [Bryobacteraceae bacterium]